MFHDHRYEFELVNTSKASTGDELIRSLQGPNGVKIELILTLGDLSARQDEGEDDLYRFKWNLNDFLLYAINHAEDW